MTTDLLSIDVSSELDTLCRAQLRGTWQIPAELVRLAERVGADRVSLFRRRRGFEISWSGSSIDAAQLTSLRTALDPKSVPRERQRAIAAIEGSKMEALLWASGLKGARLRVESSDGKTITIFEQRYRRECRLARNVDAGTTEGVEIRWSCAGLRAKRALRWLDIATRFVGAELHINGSPGPTGFVGGLFHVRLDEPLPCTVALTRTGDRPVLWLLRDGVVSARASVPGYPPFEAAVELADVVGPGASAADLRRAVAPYLNELVDRAVWMMVEVSDRVSDRSPKSRDRHCLSLLRAARKAIRSDEICRLPLLQSASGDLHYSVEDLRRMAEASGGLVAALDHDEPRDGLVDPRSTLVASTEVRTLVTELTGVRFQSPSRRELRLGHRFAERVRRSGRRVVRRLRGIVAGRDLTDDELRPQEVVAVAALQAALAPADVRLCGGGGSPARTSRGLVIPRAGRSTEAGIDLVADDPTWLYPLVLSLDVDIEPPEELRRRWLQKAGQTTAKS